tara:strand:+ start:611 stop:2527 length:1917 start_codon:yes stop_codon:yes gene_type:complete
MKNPLKSTIVCIVLLFSPTLLFSQTLQLGTLSDFQAFATTGAVTGPGTTGTCVGDVGTNDGIISGFDTSYAGIEYNNNSLTVQARIDLLRVYIHLSDIFVTNPGTHSSAFGGGDTLSPGVYAIGSAGSLAGALTLDGGGDTNAVFVIKFEGALAVTGGATVGLSGGTRSCNVYWIAEGAIAVGSGCTIKGTLLAHPGAVTLGGGCDIEGRLLSTDGAVTFGAGSDATLPAGPIAIPINILTIRPPAAAVDVLESVEGFVLFSSSGSVTNAATSGFVGHIGTDFGSISGFTTSTHIGSFYNADTTTAQAKIDLDSAYNKLIVIPKTDSTHAAVFGGDTLIAGVYYVGGAGSLSGTITLDGQNDPDAIFIFRFNGSFSVMAQSKVIFTNGTRLCNVFWIAEGAVSMGTFTYMKGTIISHGYACSMASNGNFEGRMLSTGGAVSFSTGVIYIDPLYFATSAYLPIELLSFTANVEDGHVRINWVTTTEINNDYFNVEHSVDGINFTSISTIKGAGNSKLTLNYSDEHYTSLEGVSYYRLKQTDYDGRASYSDKEAVVFKKEDLSLNVYPNPFTGDATFHTSENLKDGSLVVYNSNGVVKVIENISGQTFIFHRENLRSGLYWIKLIQDGKVSAIKKVVIID